MHLVEKRLPFEKELTQQIKEVERELLMWTAPSILDIEVASF